MILLLIIDIVLYRMPPREARGRARGRAQARKGRGGHNSHVEEADAVVEQSHNDRTHGSQSTNSGDEDIPITPSLSPTPFDDEDIVA
jgi:hypothetical protein